MCYLDCLDSNWFDLLIDRKAKKTAVKSATFQGQKAAIYARARQDADDLIRDGTSLMFASTFFAIFTYCDSVKKHKRR